MWEQFEKQKARGVEGFGLFDGQHIFKTPKLKKMRGYMRNKKRQNDFIMFHHRWPTSTVNVRRAAHPFSTGDYFGDTKYVLVHNGHVSNSSTLKKTHEELGIAYTSQLQDGTFNDSESLLWDVAMTLEGRQDSLKAYGGIAFVAAKLVDNEVTHLYFARNYGRPLNMLRNDEGIMLSSEGEGEPIAKNTLYTYNYKLDRLTHRHFSVHSYDPDYKPTYTTYKSAGSIPMYSSCSTYDSYDEDDYYLDEDGRVRYFVDDDEYTAARFMGHAEKLKSRPNFEFKSTAELDTEIAEQTQYLMDYATINDDGEVSEVQIYHTCMEAADGYFEEAFDILNTDLEYFSDHAKSTQRDMIIDLIQSALDILYMNPDWITATSYDPAYSTDDNETNQPTLQFVGQKGLL